MASAIIIDETTQRTKKVDAVDYPVARIIPVSLGIKINGVLPFRIRFSTIGIPSSYSGVPAIPLQIIGINNYIL